jgi:L-amino acid N-acyltransferase YncA
LKAIERHVKDKDAVTEIYNRAYEALIISMDTNGKRIAELEKKRRGRYAKNNLHFIK